MVRLVSVALTLFYRLLLLRVFCIFCIDLRAWPRSLLLSTIDSVCLSGCHTVRMSVCLSQTSNCFVFFVSRWNRAIFWPPVIHDPLYKTGFFNF